MVQRTDGVELSGAVGGVGAEADPDRKADSEGCDYRTRGDVGAPPGKPLHAFRNGETEGDAEQSAHQRNQHRFSDKLLVDVAGAGADADAAPDADFFGAFTEEYSFT